MGGQVTTVGTSSLWPKELGNTQGDSRVSRNSHKENEKRLRRMIERQQLLLSDLSRGSRSIHDWLIHLLQEAIDRIEGRSLLKEGWRRFTRDYCPTGNSGKRESGGRWKRGRLYLYCHLEEV